MQSYKKLVAAIACASAFTMPYAMAESYPEKPVTMIVAYSPGGGNDTVARLMAKHIEPYLGARMVVENSPGAGGQIGFTRIANAENDGYTLGILSAPSIFMIEKLRENGMALLVASSELEELVAYSTRVVVLRDRRQVKELTGDQITADNIVHAIADEERGAA